MKIQTLGHATLLLSDQNNQPLLITDPWITGSVYWRSWWLENYPNEDQLEQLSQAKYVYITHEHPDHFHPPSIRKLGKKATYLFPELPDMSMSNFLDQQNHQTQILKKNQWLTIGKEISILSVPLWSDDTILLIDTPTAFIVNLNDSKPNSTILIQIHKLKQALLDKKTIVLSSYSPASIVNSFIHNDQRVSLKNKSDYVDYLNRVNTALGADIFMPFASQAVFLRSDSSWANDYKVTVSELETYWNNKAKLLPPFSTVDLNTFKTSFVPKAEYNSKGEKKFLLIKEQEQIEQQATLDEQDIKKLRKKLNSSRLFLAVLFPKGIGFSCNQYHLIYNPLKGKVSNCDLKRLQQANFWIKIPTQSLKDSLTNDHFGDLGITMFIIINLEEQLKPVLVYLFFMLLTINDYKHNRSFLNFIRWVFSTVRLTLFTSPKIPIP
jgi:hypothetical protein